MGGWNPQVHSDSGNLDQQSPLLKEPLIPLTGQKITKELTYLVNYLNLSLVYGPNFYILSMLFFSFAL